MKVTLKTIIFGGALLCASLSHAIGRSGNGKLVGNEDGFEADAPSAYVVPKKLADGGLRLVRPFIGPQWGGDDYLDLRRLAVEFPMNPQTTRSEFVDSFVRTGWTKLSGHDPCLEIFESRNPSVRGTVIAWGIDRGVVILGADTKATEAATREIAGTMTLAPGACSWK